MDVTHVCMGKLVVVAQRSYQDGDLHGDGVGSRSRWCWSWASARWQSVGQGTQVHPHDGPVALQGDPDPCPAHGAAHAAAQPHLDTARQLEHRAARNGEV